MKVFKIIAWIALIAFIVIQFFSINRNESYTTPETDFMLVNNVPEKIQKKLQVSCYDCHSNNTAYPWYNKVQPIAWFLEDHVKEGKAELNFNEWNSLSNRRKKSKLKGIANQLKDAEMPLTSYTLIHRDAKVSEAEKKMILDWIDKVLKKYN